MRYLHETIYLNAPFPLDAKEQVATKGDLALIAMKYDRMHVMVLDEDLYYTYYLATNTWIEDTAGKGASWGSITGDINIQTDLITKFADYSLTSHTHPVFTELDPTVPDHVKAITENEITNWNSLVAQTAHIQIYWEPFKLLTKDNGDKYELMDSDPITGATGKITMLNYDWFWYVNNLNDVVKVYANSYWESNLVIDGRVDIKVEGEGTVDWGDGSAVTHYSGESFLAHDYTQFDGIVKFYGTLTSIYCATLTANLYHTMKTLPRNLVHYTNLGVNMSSGDLNDLPATVVYYYNTGWNRVNLYTAGHTFSPDMVFFQHVPFAGFGLDATMVDNLLIDLNNSAMSAGSITLPSPNAARTSASTVAVEALEGRGVVINTAQ